MNNDAIRQQIETTFLQEFMPKFPLTPFESENQAFTRPVKGAWVSMVFQPNVSKQIAIGDGRGLFYRHWGLITVHLMQAADTGIKTLHAMSDEAFAILASRSWQLPNNGGLLRTYGAKQTNRGDLNGFYAITLQIQYEHNDLLKR
jgi:hypothetical protein